MVKQFHFGKHLKPSSDSPIALCSNIFKTAFNFLLREIKLLEVIKVDGVSKNI